MKFVKIAAFCILPVIAMVVLSLVAQFSMSAPTAVSAITDSGETWWNPISWALDESAQHATMQANNALTLGVSYTQMMFVVGSMVAGIGLTLLTMAIRQGWVGKAEAKSIEQAPATLSTPGQLPPRTGAPATTRSTSPEENGQDPAFAGSPMATATT